MVNYLSIDKRNNTKSVAEYNGTKLEFWYKLFDEYAKDEVEAYIKAEITLLQGDIEGAIAIAQPFISGENTITILNETTEDGIKVTYVEGEDTRSLLKCWYDEKDFE